jgi:RHS repeat-associated protein
MTARYLTHGEETVAVVTVTGVSWLLADRIGSTRLVANKTGVVVSTIEYTAFGGIASETSATLSGNVLFTGGWFDRAVNLYQMHWRSYDPANGQWTSEDPIGFSAGDMNTRRYVGNNATNGVDRNGLEVPGFQHFYPLVLGGSDETQLLFELSQADHTAAHDVLRKHKVYFQKGVTWNQARAAWAAKTPAEHRAIIVESMKAAKIPDAMIDKYIDNIFENAEPGVNKSPTRRTRSVLRSVTKTTIGAARSAASFAVRHSATIVAGGIMFFYDKSVSAGEKSGELLADRVGLGTQLKIDGDLGLLPSTQFTIILHDKKINIVLIPDSADPKGGHFITAFYDEEHNDGTWGGFKRRISLGDLGMPYTTRVHIISRTQIAPYKTYGFSYPNK